MKNQNLLRIKVQYVEINKKTIFLIIFICLQNAQNRN